MANSKATKKALFMSIMSLLLCFTMLMGATFAWFTDTVTSANNRIQAGNLKVKLVMDKPDAEGNYDGIYEDISNRDTGDIFSDANGGQGFNWEPGKTEIVYLGVQNNGSLALKYNIILNVIDEGLIGSLEYAIIAGAKAEDVKTAENWEAVKAAAIATGDTKATGDVPAGQIIAAENGILDEIAYDSTKIGETDYFALAVHMKEEAGNEYQNKSVKIDVTVLATQKDAEEDSFGSDYDENAYNTVVNNSVQLAEALASGGDIIVNGSYNADETVDVPNWTNAPAEYIVDATVVDSVTGGTYVLDEGSRYGIVALASEGETLSLSDMNVSANSQWSVYLSNYGGELNVSNVTIEAQSGAGIYPYGTNGTTTLNDVKVNHQRLDPAYASATPWAATAVATSNGHNLIINSGTYVGSSWAVYGYNSGSNITINGGTFKASKVLQMDGVWSGSNTSVATINGGNFDGAIYLDWGTTAPEVYINGGSFTNFSATVNGNAKLVITGGTFDADPSAWIAEDYVAIDNGNGIWTVETL